MRNHLRDRKAGLDIAANRVEQKQKPVCIRAVFDCGKLWQYVLIFGGLGIARQAFMPFNLSLRSHEQINPVRKLKAAWFRGELSLRSFRLSFAGGADDALPCPDSLLLIHSRFLLEFY